MQELVASVRREVEENAEDVAAWRRQVCDCGVEGIGREIDLGVANQSVNPSPPRLERWD